MSGSGAKTNAAIAYCLTRAPGPDLMKLGAMDWRVDIRGDWWITFIQHDDILISYCVYPCVKNGHHIAVAGDWIRSNTCVQETMPPQQ